MNRGHVESCLLSVEIDVGIGNTWESLQGNMEVSFFMYLFLCSKKMASVAS